MFLLQDFFLLQNSKFFLNSKQGKKGEKSKFSLFDNVLLVVPLHFVTPSPGSDVSTQAQLVSVCAHTLRFCVRASQCTRFHLGAHDLALRFAMYKLASMPGGWGYFFHHRAHSFFFALFLLRSACAQCTLLLCSRYSREYLTTRRQVYTPVPESSGKKKRQIVCFLFGRPTFAFYCLA